MIGMPLKYLTLRSRFPCLKSPALIYFVIFSLLFSISETVIGMMITRSSAPVASCAAVISAESVDRIVLAAGV